MERIGPNKNKAEGLLEGMNSFLSEAVMPSAGCPEDTENTDLPFESLEDYSTDPIGFEEIADMVNNKVRYFFSLSAKYNHRSSEYLEVCGFLERGIKYLGSCCLTGVLLKKKGHELPKLEDLSTHWLYGMVSFNIRKLNRTVDEELSRSGAIPSKWLDMQFRYINLAERLKSTETKIHEYTSYYWLNSDKFVMRALMFTEKAYNIVDVKQHVRKPDFRLAPAFPVMNEVSGSRFQVSEKIGNASTQYSVPGTQQKEDQGSRNEDRVSTQYPVLSTQQEPGAGNQDPEKDLNSELSTLNSENAFNSQLSTFNSEEDISHSSSLISHSEEDIPHSSFLTPNFMAILERAAERSKDNEEGAICFTFEEMDALAYDAEFYMFAPDLAEVIRRKHADLFSGRAGP